MERLTDVVTGRLVMNVGAEENRQMVSEYLMATLGYAKTDILVDYAVSFPIDGEPYETEIDLVVEIDGVPMMALKCVAASLGSGEREIVAAARLISDSHILPYAVVTDGKDAIVLDGVTGKVLGEGMGSIPTRNALVVWGVDNRLQTLPAEKRERQRRVFRTYDMENVNVQRNL